jgi:hypothetical protein
MLVTIIYICAIPSSHGLQLIITSTESSLSAALLQVLWYRLQTADVPLSLGFRTVS